MTRESIPRRVWWSTVSTASGFAAAAASAVAIGRFVDPSEYGRVTVTTSVWGFLVVPIVWCGQVLARFGPEELHATGGMRESIGARLLLSAPAVLLLPAVLLVAPRAGWSPGLVLATFGWLAVMLAYDTLQWASTATQQFRAKAAANAMSRALPILLIASPALFPAYAVRSEHLLTAMVLAHAVTAAYLAFALRRAVGLAWPPRDLLRRVWRYSAPGVVGVPAESLVQWIDPLVLARYVPRAEVGFYGLAYLVISASANVTASFTAVITNELVWARARGDPSVQRAYAEEQQPRLALALGLAGLCGACVAEPLLGAVLGARFGPSGRIAAVLCVAAAFQMATITLTPIRIVTDAQAASQGARTIQAAVNVGFDLLLAPLAGGVGVAFANVLAWASNAVTLTFFLRRRAHVAARPWIALSAAALLVLVILATEPPAWLRGAVAAGLAMLSLRAALPLLSARHPAAGWKGEPT